MDSNNIPSEYKPLGAWAYVGYELLFSIPLIGFILLIVFALNNDNINRRNFARSYFCVYIILVVLLIILLLCGVSLSSFFNTVNS